MGLIEPITAKILQHIEDLVSFVLPDASRYGPLDELPTLSLQFLGFLFPYRLPQKVRFAGGEARQLHGDLDHLILVNDYPIGVL